MRMDGKGAAAESGGGSGDGADDGDGAGDDEGVPDGQVRLDVGYIGAFVRKDLATGVESTG
jgi:hypothetical protein